ncbi:MAG: hypothetical protein M1817_002862 [Caeruleum heppii]|nr:MAG: hypothetical protein M1817_002862 [Caeruleum heppii]
MPSSPSPTTTPSPRPSKLPLSESGTEGSPASTALPVRHIPPRLSLAGTESDDGRRPSIQFVSRERHIGLPTGSPKGSRPGPQKRLTSPPPPSTFQNRVSFDTFDNKDASDFSLTLNSKHKDYQYTRRSRTFLCGTDQNDYSEFALEWLIDELVDDGDEIVCLRVVDKDSKISSDASVEEGRYRREAKKLLDQIIEKNREEEKAISLVLEFAVGKVHDTIQRMIQIYEPAILIVGTRGRSLGGLQGLLPGSVSKYCLQYSPVPVIVVRPTYKRERKKQKRQADPSRRGYMEILEKSGTKGTHTLDKDNRSSLVDDAVPASDQEAAAVAAAIGLPQFHENRPSSSGADMPALTKVQSGRSEVSGRSGDATTPESLSPSEDQVLMDDPRSPGIVLRSPGLNHLESPDGSASESSDEDSDGDNRFEAVPGEMLVREEAEEGPSPGDEGSGQEQQHEEGRRKEVRDDDDDEGQATRPDMDRMPTT